MKIRSFREELILRYLERRLDTDAAAEWEGHYLGCADCPEEIRATEPLPDPRDRHASHGARAHRRRHGASIRAWGAIVGIVSGIERAGAGGSNAE